jgi:hypothetical protein
MPNDDYEGHQMVAKDTSQREKNCENSRNLASVTMTESSV